MERNQATGLILIAGMLMLYFYFFAPKQQEPKNEPAKTEVAEGQNTVVQDSIAIEQPVIGDSLQYAIDQQQYGVFAKGARGEASASSLENDLVKINISNQAKITGVTLKNFDTYAGEKVNLISPDRNDFSLALKTLGKQIDLYKMYYTAASSSNDSSHILTLTLDIAPGQRVIHTYTLPKSSYELSYQLKMEGLDKYVSEENLAYQWHDNIKTQERDVELSRNNSTINYHSLDGGFDGLAAGSKGTETEAIEDTLNWVSIKQRFFVAGIVAHNGFSKGNLTTSVNENDPTTVKQAKVNLSLPAAHVKAGKANFTYYFGPNAYHILGEVAEDFENNLHLGWPPMKWINRFVIIPLFDFLNNFIGNYGVIIIVMVLLIKLVLSPLSYKSYLSMAKMKVLKPELDEIKEKYGDDMTKAQQEQMKLYQKVGVSPVSGCIPMLLQMPILFAMFYFFPQSIELRGESFLWAEDLSTYDSILDLPFTIPLYGDHVSLFVLLMTMSTILYTWSNQQVSTVQGPMKTFSYLMPVIFMFVLNSYPAALSFYYFISNIVTFGQQALIRKFVDEDKIRVILEENKKRNVNKKKSKFQMKLEEAMKASNQNQSKKKK